MKGVFSWHISVHHHKFDDVKNGKFPTEWKKPNVVLAHKKGDKQNFKNHCPISLFPTAGKNI